MALDPEMPIIGFARRMTGYKRPDCCCSPTSTACGASPRATPFQIVLAGKAHPHDDRGQGGDSQHPSDHRSDLRGKIACVFLPNYDMESPRRWSPGVDVWLNTPLPPMEASGTSGMKAALNGVLNLSVLDGWWIEACIEGVTGWSIGHDGDAARRAPCRALYDKLDTCPAAVPRATGSVALDDEAGDRQHRAIISTANA